MNVRLKTRDTHFQKFSCKMLTFEDFRLFRCGEMMTSPYFTTDLRVYIPKHGQPVIPFLQTQKSYRWKAKEWGNSPHVSGNKIYPPQLSPFYWENWWWNHGYRSIPAAQANPKKKLSKSHRPNIQPGLPRQNTMQFMPSSFWKRFQSKTRQGNRSVTYQPKINFKCATPGCTIFHSPLP